MAFKSARLQKNVTSEFTIDTMRRQREFYISDRHIPRVVPPNFPYKRVYSQFA